MIETGEPIVAKAERETFDDRPDAWVSTTKLALRDEHGKIIDLSGSLDKTAPLGVKRSPLARDDPQSAAPALIVPTGTEAFAHRRGWQRRDASGGRAESPNSADGGRGR